MKKIEIVLLPSKINDVKDALRKIGINKMTVSKVGRSHGQTSSRGYCRGGKYESRYEPVFLSKTKIEMEVAEEELEKALDAIEESAKGNVYGEGKVFVYFLDKTIELGKRARSVSRI